MFVDREEEMAFLEAAWGRTGPELLVLWGRRRVGKTALVREFVRDKPHVYFLGEATTAREQTRRFAASLGDFFEDRWVAEGGLGWFQLLDYARSKGKRMVLAIDEFPYLLAANPGLASEFQRAWDESLSRGNLVLILLGSSIGMMENDVLGRRSPLFGRRTGQWQVRPLPFSATREFRAGRPFEDRLSHYAIAGGIPAYWLALSAGAGLWDNLTGQVLARGSFLYDEVPFLLREELREPRLYFAILQAVASGKRRLSEVANAVGLPVTAVNKYLSVLQDLQVVEREVSVTEDQPHKSRMGLWRIREPFVAFWFRYVFPRRAELEMGLANQVVSGIRETLDFHLSDVYERVACELVWGMRGELFPFSRVGRHWGGPNELDLVALDPGSNTALFGEVKWSRKPVGLDVLAHLKHAAAGVRWGRAGRRDRYCLFSRAGFTRDLTRVAREEGVLLVEGDEVA